MYFRCVKDWTVRGELRENENAVPSFIKLFFVHGFAAVLFKKFKIFFYAGKQYD